jgi:A/G-specific adenine glycosylase
MNRPAKEHMRQSEKIKQLHRHLFRWYSANKRPLPWRRTNDPYKILISEIMLQQTQVSRVVEKYPAFLKQFPTIHKLTSASKASVIRAWQGLGYNNRAVRLWEFARVVVSHHKGKIPNDPEATQTLPGIGQYTAHALGCFAFNQNLAVVDVNICRVLSRIFWRMRNIHEYKEAATIWNFAGSILPRGRASDWNQALMDFGATICTAQKPICSACPISRICSSYEVFLKIDRTRRRKKRSTERLYGGQPIRIYRGRIVEQLRRLNGKSSIDVHSLGRLIKPNFSRKETDWLTSILSKLQREGLLHLRRSGSTLVARLPQT